MLTSLVNKSNKEYGKIPIPAHRCEGLRQFDHQRPPSCVPQPLLHAATIPTSKIRNVFNHTIKAKENQYINYPPFVGNSSSQKACHISLKCNHGCQELTKYRGSGFSPRGYTSFQPFASPTSSNVISKLPMGPPTLVACALTSGDGEL